jgi:tetratricopeptide (TPR) repeat protein
VTGGPSRGLPPRIYLPILAVTALAFLGIVGYFLKAGLGVTGSALGPVAQQGDSNIRATAAPNAGALASAEPNEVVVPQTGGAPNEVGGGSMPQGSQVGGGSPAQAAGGGPPAPVQRMLADLRGRLQANPNDLAAIVGLANLYFDAGKFAQSAAYYKRALALDPDNPDTRTDYATALHGENLDLDSLAQLRIVLEKRPRFPEALFNRGIVANAIGRRTEAIAAFKLFLKVAPNDERAGDARTALGNLGAS